MGSIFSYIPTEGIWVCVLVPIVLIVIFTLVCKLFNIQLVPDNMKLPPPKKTDFYTILGGAAKKYSEIRENN